jgi:hypothetical protein
MATGAAEVIALGQLAIAAAEWVGLTPGAVRRPDERRAALLVEAGGMTVASVRALDAGFRRNLSKLTLFDTDLSKEERRQIAQDISDFAHQRVITPLLHRHVSHLQAVVFGVEPRPEKAPPYPITFLYEHGWGVLDGVGFSEGEDVVRVTGFPGGVEEIRQLWQNIKQADREKDAARVRRFAEEHMPVLDNEWLLEAAQQWTELKEALVVGYDLPPALWSDSVMTLTPELG